MRGVELPFYRHAEQAVGGAASESVAGLTLCLAQVHAALHVFPRLLAPDSNLLFRMQFLTAYHASNALRKCLNGLPPWLPRATGTGFGVLAARNVVAHYELLGAARFAVGAERPLLAAVAGVSGLHADQLCAAVVERLSRISALLGPPLAKPILAPLRARLLGSHT
jgi:hypothetical protein